MFPLIFYLLNSDGFKNTSVSRLLEIGNPKTSNLFESDPLSDQAVKLLRSENVQKKLKLNSMVSVYKYAPSVVRVTATSSDKESAIKDVNAINEYLKGRYNVNQQGMDGEESTLKKSLINLLISIGIGLFIGILSSLIVSYFKNF